MRWPWKRQRRAGGCVDHGLIRSLEIENGIGPEAERLRAASQRWAERQRRACADYGHIPFGIMLSDPDHQRCLRCAALVPIDQIADA
jgi:hypothetical protein